MQLDSDLLRSAEHLLPFSSQSVGAEVAQHTGELGFNCLAVHKNPQKTYEAVAKPGPHIHHGSIQVRYGISGLSKYLKQKQLKASAQADQWDVRVGLGQMSGK